MKFCYNCGAALSGTGKFCGKCGARMEHAARSVPSEEAGESKSGRCTRHGIIFTNLCPLATRLGTDRAALRKLLEQYADAMASADIHYQLVDVSDYVFVSQGAGRKADRVSLADGCTWVEYQHILYDVICHEKERGLPESNYLFIIGGHDIVPVPVINHYINDPDLSDDDIETDLLYAYPYGPHTQRALESQQLYKQEMYFLVGRLPVPTDADLSYLTNYLQNALNVRYGVPVTKVYAQCDPHWKELTAHLLAPFGELGMLPDRSNISGRFCYGNVMLGPEITSEHISSVMDEDTDLIFLNLHGSDRPSDSGYCGEIPPHTRHYLEIFPTAAMMIPERYNIFVAEACYGGRFIGYDTLRSMIQAGLSHKTVIGLASSRTAFGMPHPPASSADVICLNFVAGLLSGYSAGEAMLFARQSFFGEDGILSDMSATTLAEFNLFGDPSLRAAIAQGADRSARVLTKNIAPKNFPIGYEMTVIKSGKPGEQSLLGRVRSAVDANVQAISNAIGKELYAQYGLSPREPQTIKKVKYANGQERLLFSYNEPSDGSAYSVKTLWRVTTSTDGKIESVLTTK